MFNGKKTYIVAIATLVYAVGGVYLGQLELQHAVELILVALGLGALRKAVK